MTSPRLLIAGIGNLFLGDDAFGVQLAQRLMRRSWPPSVRVVDFGIRGLDLAYALADGYDAAILLDAAPRGQAPGTLYVIEPDLPPHDPSAPPTIETHSLDVVKVLRLAASMGNPPRRILLLGCEPAPLPAPDQMQMDLSPPVQAAIDSAIPLAESLVEKILAEETKGAETWQTS